MSIEENNKILNIISKYDDYNYSVYNIDENEQSYVMYNVVNTSLKMGKGKLAAQVGHGVHKMAQYCLYHEKELWMKYINSNFPKIVLKTKNQDHLMEVLEKTKDIFKCYVVDEEEHK